MIKKPKVSVLTPIYNTNPVHLKECIEGVLNQNFTDFEFLILNDSPENKEIEKIVKSYAAKDKRIKYHKNQKNLGISASRNKLLDMAQGEYLAILDHDDISLPMRLEKEVEYLDKHSGVGVVGSWMQYFGDRDVIHKTPEHDTDIKVALTDNCFIAHTTSMIRKSILDENNIRYEEEYSPCEDYQLWYRLMGLTNFYNIQQILVMYRWYQSNTSNAQADRMKMGHRAISLEIRNKFPAYWQEFVGSTPHPTQIIRYEAEKQKNIKTYIRLFGIIPLIKIKHGWIRLFEIIPICKIKRK